MGRAKRHTTTIRPKAVGDGIFRRSANIDKCRFEVAADVISGVAVEWVGMDARVAYGEYGINSGRII